MPTEKEDLPGTLKRSPSKAQRTYAKTLDSAEEQYDSEARSHQTAWSAVKHSFEKVGDHWEEKDEKGPSDPQAKQRGAAARNRPKRTHGGVDAEGNTKEQLYERARKAGVSGRSRMTKAELADAIARKEG
jgi:cation transport regulator ChaB